MVRGRGTVSLTIIRSITVLASTFIHTNTIEGYFSTMKRGITGVYHHVSAQHLKRYLAEYDFRYNERMALNVSDAERTIKAVAGVVGKRLTYQQSASQPDGVPV